MANTEVKVPVKKLHKDWRKVAKKLRRKRVRQKKAKDRDLRNEEEHAKLLQNPHYQIWLQEQDALEKFQEEIASRDRDSNEEKWLRRELLAQKKFKEEKKRHDALEEIKEKERLRIQQEFEEQQKLVRQRIEEKKRLAEEKRRKHELLLEKIQDYINGVSELPEELRESADTNPGKEPCPFFIKTASCRFGDKCSRNHSRPGISQILLLPHFFSNIRLEQPSICEYGSDLALEFSETELYRDYDSFFVDVTDEMIKFGQLRNFQTCKNFEAHLRGNVYVEFDEERNALHAYQQLQGRYYAGKRINVEFCKLTSWKSAICGLSLSRKCPKGRNCNFLHVFKNPGNRYNLKDPIGERSQRRHIVEPMSSTNPNLSWNDDDSKTRRNWRWSESPDRDIRRPASQCDRNDGSRRSTQSHSSTTNDNHTRNSLSSSRSHHKDHSRRSSRHHSKDRDRSSSHCKDRERSSSHSKDRKRRSRSKSKGKKKRRRRKRSKSKSKGKSSKRSK